MSWLTSRSILRVLRLALALAAVCVLSFAGWRVSANDDPQSLLTRLHSRSIEQLRTALPAWAASVVRPVPPATVTVTDAGNGDVNGTYTQNGTANGKNLYDKNGGCGGSTGQCIQWSGTRWEIIVKFNGTNVCLVSTVDCGVKPPATGWTNNGCGSSFQSISGDVCTPGTTYTFNGTTNSDWATASNWSTGVVPTTALLASGDAVVIAANCTMNDVTIAFPSGTSLTVNSSRSLSPSLNTFITINSGATLTVNATGSISQGRITNAGTMDIYGSYTAFYMTNNSGGVLNVKAGGSYSCPACAEAMNAGSTINNDGTLHTGTPSTWQSTVNNNATGVITDGGNGSQLTFGASSTVNNYGSLVSRTASTSGIFNNKSTGTLSMPDTCSFTVKSGGAFTNDGTITIGNSNNFLNINSGGTLTNNATIKGIGTITQSGTLTNSTTASIAPGLSPGKLTVTGNLDPGSGTYNCEINGTVQGTGYDWLAVSGAATLTNAKLVVDWGAFTPSGGQTYTVMTFGSRTGTFASVTIPPVSGLVFSTNYTSTTVEITAATLTIGFHTTGGALNNYYNGGTDAAGNSGPNVGISGSSNSASGGTLDGGANPTLSVPAGFTTGFAVDAINVAVGFSINVYDGENATGTLLASQSYNLNGNITGSVTFAGIARSVRLAKFSGSPSYDNLTFGSATVGTPIAEPPGVTTNAATSVMATTATLNATVNPGGATTTAQFEYGTTTSYGSTASITLSPNNGTTGQSVSANITGLMANTTYHFRVTGTNSVGSRNGSDLMFTTPVANNPPTVASDAGSRLFIARFAASAIARANIDGTNVIPAAITPGGTVLGIAMDEVRGKMYWTDGAASGHIGRANLDGTGLEPNFITGASIASPSPISVDAATGAIYWGQVNGGSSALNGVWRANADGTGVTQFITISQGTYAVVVAGGKLYYTPNDGTRNVSRINLDGTGSTPAFLPAVGGGSGTSGLAVDTVNQKIYFGTNTGSTAGCANLDGTGINLSLFTTGGAGNDPAQFTLDPVAGYVYYTAYRTQNVGRVKLDGTSNNTAFITSLSGSGVTINYGITVGSADFEATQATRTGAYSDPDGNTVTLSVTNGPGSVTKTGTSSGTWTWTYTPPDGPVTHNVTITATDSNNATSTTTFSIAALNVAPTIALTGDSAVDINTSYTLNLGAITDPGADTVTGYSINWGDGNTENFSGNPASTSKTHTYATAGDKTISVSLTDEDGTHTNAGTKTITVTCTAPTVTTQPSSQSVSAGATVTFTAAASDNPAPTVQWQVKVPAGSFTDLSGATQATLSLTATAAHHGNEYRAVFTSACSTDTSSAATLTVSGGAVGLVISEFRFRGSGGLIPANASTDEFVEIANRSDSPVTVSSSDGSAGWAVAALDDSNNPTVLFTIPNGTVIGPVGRWLGVNSQGYSLADYGGSQAAAGDATWRLDIPDGSGLALFTTASTASFSTATRLDGVGFSGVSDALFREGAGLSPTTGINTDGEFTFLRRLNQNSGLPEDTGSNGADFDFLATSAATFNGRVAELGAPGPENSSSPRDRNGGGTRSANYPQMTLTLLDPAVAANANPNQQTGISAADKTGLPGLVGSIYLRRTYTNNTGAPVTKLRLRIVELTTLNSPIVFTPKQAQFRVMSSTDQTVTVGGVPTLVKGLTLEEAPTQSLGGGINATLVETTINGGAPLAPGASVRIVVRLGAISGGAWLVRWNIEAIAQ